MTQLLGLPKDPSVQSKRLLQLQKDLSGQSASKRLLGLQKDLSGRSPSKRLLGLPKAPSVQSR